MAEIATIARPYAEALFKAAGDQAEKLGQEVAALAGVAADPALRQFADNPKVTTATVFNVVSDVLGRQGVVLGSAMQNFLGTVLDNGRLAALPEIAAQFHRLLSARSGVSDVMDALERRFGRKLNAQVSLKPELIGGIRVVVGDEVLDTSVKARLEKMKTALTA
jgi:F-type H+-transporting ATPase subunit delta